MNKLQNGHLEVLLLLSETWDQLAEGWRKWETEFDQYFVHFGVDRQESMYKMRVWLLLQVSARYLRKRSRQWSWKDLEIGDDAQVEQLSTLLKYVGESVPRIVAVAVAHVFEDLQKSYGDGLYRIVSQATGRSIEQLYMLERSGRIHINSTLKMLQCAIADGTLKRQRVSMELLEAYYDEAARTSTIDVLVRSLKCSIDDFDVEPRLLFNVKNCENRLRVLQSGQRKFFDMGVKKAAALLQTVRPEPLWNSEADESFGASRESRSLLQSAMEGGDMAVLFEFDGSVRRMLDMYQKDVRSCSAYSQLFKQSAELFQIMRICAVISEWERLQLEWQAIQGRGTCEVYSSETRKREIVGVAESEAAMMEKEYPWKSRCDSESLCSGFPIQGNFH